MNNASKSVNTHQKTNEHRSKQTRKQTGKQTNTQINIIRISKDIFETFDNITNFIQTRGRGSGVNKREEGEEGGEDDEDE